MFVVNKWQKDCCFTFKYKRKDYLKWQCLRQRQLWKLKKDLCTYLLSLEGEDDDSVIFMVFGFHSVGMLYPDLLF